MKKSKTNLINARGNSRGGEFGHTALLAGITIFSCSELLAVSEQDLRQAILAQNSFTSEQLAEMDVNGDGVVDVADLVMYLQTSEPALPVEGYKWVLSATFGGSTGNAMPFSYGFVLDIEPADLPYSGVCGVGPGEERLSIVGQLEGFDPTRPIFKQDIAQPGQVPGSARPNNERSRTIPTGTLFCSSEEGGSLVLTSDPVIIEADDPTNPTSVQLLKAWRIELFRSELEAPTLTQGSIVEYVFGFLPDDEAHITIGTVFAQRHSPLELDPIEVP